MSDPTPWTETPYVLCEDCDRETLAKGWLDIATQVTCSHCGAILQVTEVQVVRSTRCAVVQPGEEQRQCR